MKKTVRRFQAAGIFAVLTLALVALALIAPDFFFSFYPALSRRMLAALAAVSGLFSFALWEWLALGLFVWALVTLVRAIRKKRAVRWLSGAVMGMSIGVFLFVGLWGLNHFGPPIEEKMDLSVAETSVDQLQDAAAYYRDMANRLSTQVPRDADGLFAPGSFAALAGQAGQGYEVLAQRYDVFDGSTARVKKLASSALFGKMGVTGIFVDFTGESCVSTTTFVNALPFTMCHEIGHRMGFAAENEANFAAFLACEASESAVFRYSGYYEAFIYCYNALFKVDRQAAEEVWAGVNETVRADVTGSRQHYQATISKTAEKVSDTVNDTYLKVFSHSDGVQSYGQVADLLIAWYLQKDA